MFAISTSCCNSVNVVAERLLPLWQNGFLHFEFTARHVGDSANWLDKPWKISNLAIEPPLLDKIAERPSLAAERPHERHQAIAQVFDLCEVARQAKAHYLVLWPGAVLASPGQPETSQIGLRPPDPKLLEARQQKASGYVERLCRSLFAICQKEPGVILCIPPARSILEIGLLQEVQWILEDLAKWPVQYWHNTAHAYVQEQMGLAKADAWLSTYGAKTVGVHYEDFSENRWLCPPGTGETDFAKVAKDLPAKAIRVLRAGHYFSNDEILAGCQFVKDLQIL